MLLAALGALAASGTTVAAAAAAASDVLDRPARMSPLAAERLITGIARAGDRLVAVGQRGHIVHSEDGGRLWHYPSQAQAEAVGRALARKRNCDLVIYPVGIPRKPKRGWFRRLLFWG